MEGVNYEKIVRLVDQNWIRFLPKQEHLLLPYTVVNIICLKFSLKHASYNFETVSLSYTDGGII